jgi:brefeldin A-inhibited guanine nucleotide-exchange protein
VLLTYLSSYPKNLDLQTGVLDAIDEDCQSRVFVNSVHLDSETIVEFFHALTTVSLEELAATPSARVFALSKIVEVCHHNMNRPRIVWTIIWKGLQSARLDQRPWLGLSEYFVDIGCHENLQVAMFAMDALRQVCLLCSGH